MIILEGPNNGGKSTLGESLTKLSGLPVVHGGGPPKDYDEIRERVQRIANTPNVIHDRCSAISELVYGPVIRGNSMFGEVEHQQHMEMLQKAGAVVVFCCPFMSNMVRQNVDTHGDAEHRRKCQERLRSIYDKYNEVMEKVSFSLPVVHYNYNCCSANELYNIIRKAM